MAIPAAPVLASNIWLSDKDESAQLEHDEPPEPPAKRRKLNTGVKEIDTALDGGLDYGSLHCITAEPDQNVKEVVQALLISHLCCASNNTATVIDSTLSFDLMSLYRALDATLKESPSETQDAKIALERLKIMKVFDQVGLSEAIAEIREDLENESDAANNEPPKIFKSTIEDSEDEDEMLDDPSTPKKQAPTVAHEESVRNPPRRLLVIDSVSKVMAPLIKNNYAHGQAMLSSLMRSLGHITREHDLCAVLVSSASNKPASEDESLSFFSSCTIRPALGPAFDYMLDMQLYLHQIRAQKVGEAEKQGKVPDMVNVLEVVQDRYGPRYGRWGAFSCNDDGRLADVP